MVEQDAVDRIQKARSSAFPTAETYFSTPATNSSAIRTSQISLASCISDANQTVLSDPGLILVPIPSITHAVILSSAPNPPTRFPMLFTIRAAIDINRKPAQTVSALFRMRTRRSSLPWRAQRSRAPHCETPRLLPTGILKINCHHPGERLMIRTRWITLPSWRRVLHPRHYVVRPARSSLSQLDQLPKRPRRASASFVEPAASMSGRKLRWMQRGNPIALGPTRPLRF